MKIRSFIFSLLLTFLATATFAQTDDFKKETYIDQLEEVFKNMLKNEEYKTEFEAFKTNWEESKIPDNQKDGIVTVSNSLKTKRARVKPHYFYFIKTINGYVSKNRTGEYPAWQSKLDYKLQNNTLKEIEKFLHFSSILIADNQLTKSRTAQWFFKTARYSLLSDPNTGLVRVEFQNFDLGCTNQTDTFFIYGTSGTYYPEEQKWVGQKGTVTWDRMPKHRHENIEVNSNDPQQKRLNEKKRLEEAQFQAVKSKFSRNNVYAEIPGRYVLETRINKFMIDSVSFTNTNINQRRVLGRLENGLMTGNKIFKPDYPKFYAYTSITLPNLFPDVSYTGGFSVEGIKFAGTKVDGKKAEVVIKKNNSDFVTTKADMYQFENEKISSRSAEFVMNMNNNEKIYHNNVRFDYLNKLSSGDISIFEALNTDPRGSKIDENSSLLILTRTSGDDKSFPFIDTYHKMNIFASSIVWEKGDTSMYVYTSRLTRDKTAKFESQDFFVMYKYERYNDMGFNHLLAIHQMTRSKPGTFENTVSGNQFIAEQYVAFLNSNFDKQYGVKQVHFKLLELEADGFIMYDTDKNQKLVTVNQMLYDFVQYRFRYVSTDKSNGKDFDNIHITSDLGENPYGINAVISLVSNDMHISQISPFYLSAGRNVAVETSDITVYENRNMKFGGNLYAGGAKIEGNDFRFNYKNFNVDIQDTSTLSVRTQMTVKDDLGNKVVKLDEKGEPVLKVRLNKDKKPVLDDNKEPIMDTVYETEWVQVESKVERLKGNILIDKTENKSGMVNNEAYPQLFSRGKSYIYYDQTIGESYKKEKFNFEADEFDIDSLGSLTENSIKMKGTFKSSVFKDFQDTLTLGQDKVLGLKTDKSGEQVRDGIFWGEVILDGTGLNGKGKLKYLTTTAHSDNFTFYPDSIIGALNKLEVKELQAKDLATVEHARGEFSQVNSDSANYAWIFDTITPPNDFLRITNQGYTLNYNIKGGQPTTREFGSLPPIQLYETSLPNGKADLDGVIYINKDGMFGVGTMNFLEAEIKPKQGEQFQFEAKKFETSVAEYFKLKTNINDPKNKHAFTTTDMQVNVDLEKRHGIFISQKDSALADVNFPANKFKTSTDHFVWYIDQNRLDIGGAVPDLDTAFLLTNEEEFNNYRDAGNRDYRLLGANLKSTKKWGNDTSKVDKRDELNFDVNSAEYIIDEVIIKAKKANHMQVADATIQPNAKYDIIIERDAKIRPFSEAVIIVAGHTTFYDAEVEVINRQEYNATAKTKYPYNDQPVPCNPIRVIKKDTTFITEAVVGSTEIDSLVLSEQFKFRVGKKANGISAIIFKPSLNQIEFNGKIELKNTCENIEIQELDFNAIVNPDTIMIPINGEMKNGKKKLFSGYYLTQNINNFIPYARFLAPLKSTANDGGDLTMLNPIDSTSVLAYDLSSNSYKIASPEKIFNPDTLGKIMQIQNKICIIKGEGEFDFNLNLADVGLRTVGTATYNSTLNNQFFNVAMGLDFFIPDPIVKDMVDEINLAYFEKTANFKGNNYIQKYRMWVNNEAIAEKTISKLRAGELFEAPKEYYKHTLMISEVNLNWDTTRNSFISEGKIGLSNIKNKNVSVFMDGKIEIVKRERQSTVHIYLEPEKGKWYYFNLSATPEIKNNITFSTSSSEINNKINEMKNKELKEGQFEFVKKEELGPMKEWLKNVGY